MDSEFDEYGERIRVTSPSKRWTTTTSAANNDITRANIYGSDDVRARKERLRASKLNSTKGSISFGHESVKYISDCHESQINALKGGSTEGRAAQAKHVKDMKANLTTTNFCLGDEPVDYTSTNRESMLKVAVNDASDARPALNKALKEAIKKSSLHFGNEPVNYQSVSSEGYVNKGAQGSVNFDKRKSEIKEMTTRLRKHNFSLGEEKVDYTSDYQSGFSTKPELGSMDKSKLKKQIEEIRKCHFTLGHDKVVYQSDAQRAGNLILEHKSSDIGASIEHAKAMKKALQRTSIVIGDDEEYM